MLVHGEQPSQTFQYMFRRWPVATSIDRRPGPSLTCGYRPCFICAPRTGCLSGSCHRRGRRQWGTDRRFLAVPRGLPHELARNGLPLHRRRRAVATLMAVKVTAFGQPRGAINCCVYKGYEEEVGCSPASRYNQGELATISKVFWRTSLRPI